MASFLELLSRVNWKNVAVLAIAVALIAVYAKVFAVAVLIAGVVFVSFVVNHFRLRIIGLELVTFATVVAGIVYGPLVGAALGAVLVFIHLVLSGYFGLYYLWVVPEYAAAGYMVSQFAGQDIVFLGMMVTLLLHTVNIVFTAVFTRHNVFKYVTYAATNVVFNFIMFTLFGPWMAGLLG